MHKRVSLSWLGATLQSALLPLVMVLVVLAIAGCGGGGAGGVAPTPPPVASAGSLQASQSGALLGYVQGKLTAQVDQGQAFSSYNGFYRGGEPVSFATVAASGADIKSVASTTLQERGVDEADLLKTDGQRLYRLSAGATDGSRLDTLRIERRLADGSLRPDGSLTLTGTDRFEGLHVTATGERVALLGQTEQWYTIMGAGLPGPAATSTFAPGPITPPQTVLELVASKTGVPLSRTHTIRIDGQLVDSRMIGNMLYLVTTWYPRLDAVPLPGAATSAERKAAVARLTTRDLLPSVTITTAGASTPSVSELLMADTDCYLQTQNASSAVLMTTVTAFDLSSPTAQRASRCFLGGTEALYMSSQNLYLATSRHAVQSKGGIVIYPGQVSTDIHKFGIDGMRINYRGTGEVTGHLGWDGEKKPYRMSEHQGNLRVLSYIDQFGWFGEPGAAKMDGKPSPALLTVLREDSAASTLQTIATLPNSRRPAPIGLSGEQVYAVRFLADRGYVVTFRRTDPLYVLDLSDPTDPKVSGELKTNGYSDYLLPAGDGLLVGVGKDASASGRVQGVKVSLFDVADPTAPKELASRVIGKAGSASALEYSRHGVNLLTAGGKTRLALPVLVSETPDPSSPEWFYPSYQALFKFDIDPIARTMTERPALVGQVFSPELRWSAGAWLGYERSVQVDANVYYLTSQGQLMTSAW
ncbi:beta-propeller domain-containing protein [Rhodoferax sp.]|uniref:beta-propeller domain-containing protein n=1 Tax=Rhodoferax sp. TaxID=50421 RepID=UPI002777FCFC|nr:beta-propeller domain-containing protein [Rhodoferax sp.]